ncbi:MAG: glycosyltransferase family 39 protein [Chloroflexales bacterium]|nr:glycosyltransferase family 39 protein [Chloroflexales bacterium]
MKSTISETTPFNVGRAGTQSLSLQRMLHVAALGAIVILAAVLNFYNLEALGYANRYYTAAVESMLQSWHNFFFVAAEPGGAVTVDKPPVGLWLQAISAYFFGVNGFAVMLPQILAGILSVLLLYHLVRRSLGTAAGLIAAFVLAITPVVVATTRNNTMDSVLVFTLLLATWAFIKATETRRLGYLLLGACLVGVGFNIKMLQAYLVLPALYALYVLGSSERLWRKVVNLALASGLLVAVSLSWAIVVDLTPADQRPYIGSSTNNTVMELIIGHNGLNRLWGLFGSGNNSGLPPQAGMMNGDGALPQPGMMNDGGLPPQTGAMNDGRPGGLNIRDNEIGTVGALRLFTAPLNNEASWLLPFGLFSIGLVAFRSRLSWPLSPKHQALILWGGWLLTAAIFFSVANFFHAYYLIMLGAPLAALVGIGVIELWRLGMQRRWLALALLLLVSGATLALQYATATQYMQNAWWLPSTVALFCIGVGLFLAAARFSWQRISTVGFSCVIAALLVTPAIWSWQTMLHPSGNMSLPNAYEGTARESVNNGELQIYQSLLDYLEPRTQDTTYLMAVPSSMQGADYVIATGRPVLYIGGFMGQDEVVNSDDLAGLVADGELRYIFWGEGMGPFGNKMDISDWIASACVPVEGFEAIAQNFGPPDGTHATLSDSADSRPFRMMQMNLYKCGE